MKPQKIIKTLIFVYKFYYLINSFTHSKKNNSKINQSNLIKIIRILWLVRIINYLVSSSYFLGKKVTSKCITDLLLSRRSNIQDNKFIGIMIIIFLYCGIASGATKKLSLPRFVSIKANEVNARNGPAIKSPIEWIFVKKGEPVEITAEYEQWRQIRDIKGEGGWVHSSVLSGKRSIIIVGDKAVLLYKNPQQDENILAQIHLDVRCQLQKCKEEWCKIQCNTYTGWVLKKQLWGVYKDEVL